MNQLTLELQPALSYRTIPLTQNQVAIVDAADYDTLAAFKWCATTMKRRKTFYAVRAKVINGKKTLVSMHRELLGLTRKDRVLVDHEDGNGLNNRRGNLRKATNQQNLFNRGANRNSPSGLKGAHRDGPRWKARIKISGKEIHLGCFGTPEEAHAAYAAAVKQYCGEFSNVG